MKYKRIVVTGSLAYDHIMSIPSTFDKQISRQDSDLFTVSYFMKQFDREFGGTAGNITYNLSLLHIPTLTISAAGKDSLRYLKHLQSLQNVDTSGIKVYKNDMSANGFVMSDSDQNKIWGFYEGAMKKASSIKLDTFVKETDLLVISANDPLAMVRYVQFAIEHSIDYVFDPAYTIPHLPSSDLQQACEHAKIIFGNEYEIASLLERLGWNLRQLLQLPNILVTTQGSKGSSIANDSKLIKIDPISPDSEDIESTGVGDAYRSGFLAGYLHDRTLTECGRIGSIVATYALNHVGSQTHTFTLSSLCNKYQKIYDSECPLPIKNQ